MKIATKKIVAREFLFLITVVVLGLIAFVCTYPYNAYRHNQAEKLSATINAKKIISDSLKRVEKVKITPPLPEGLEEVKPPDNTKWIDEVKVTSKKNTAKSKNKIQSKKETEWKPPSDLVEVKNENQSKKETEWKPPSDAVPEGYSEITPKEQAEIDSLNQLQAKINELQTKKEGQSELVLNLDEQIVFGINSLIVLVILLFGLRYLFYAFRWSLKTLRM